MKFIGQVDMKGHMPDDLRQLIATNLRSQAGKMVTVEIKRFVKRRTDNQNRFFHGPFLNACLAMYHEFGNVHMDEDDVKDDLKKLFGLRTDEITRPDGTVERGLKSTRDYTTIEIEEFMEKLRAHFAPYGYMLPYPNEVI